MGDSDSSGVVSDQELTSLCELFVHFEGAPDPLAPLCKAAEFEFNSMARQIFDEKVAVSGKFPGLDFRQFFRFVRIQCRRRVDKNSPSLYPCLPPTA